MNDSIWSTFVNGIIKCRVVWPIAKTWVVAIFQMHFFALVYTSFFFLADQRISQLTERSHFMTM